MRAGHSLNVRGFIGLFLCALALVATTAEAGGHDAPMSPAGLRRDVLDLALRAYECGQRRGSFDKPLLTVIDYSLPSSARRLWVLDMERRRVLFNELVAHGKNSGDELAMSFSNAAGSHKSSLGLFRTERHLSRSARLLAQPRRPRARHQRPGPRAAHRGARGELREPRVSGFARTPRPELRLSGPRPPRERAGHRSHQGRQRGVRLLPRLRSGSSVLPSFPAIPPARDKPTRVARNATTPR